MAVLLKNLGVSQGSDLSLGSVDAKFETLESNSFASLVI
jgi:hypothetical protein